MAEADVTVCGLGIRPPSVAMTVIGWSAVVAVSDCVSANLYEREIDALRIRKRYLRGSTFMLGRGTPLTRITSPMTEDSLLSS